MANQQINRCIIISHQEIAIYSEIALCSSQNGQNENYWWHQMQARMWRNWVTHTVLVGIQNNTATLEASCKTKYMLIIWPSNFTLQHFPQKNKYLFLHTKLQTNVRHSFICDSQKLKTTKLSFDRWRIKLCYIYQMGYYKEIKRPC